MGAANRVAQHLAALLRSRGSITVWSRNPRVRNPPVRRWTARTRLRIRRLGSCSLRAPFVPPRVRDLPSHRVPIRVVVGSDLAASWQPIRMTPLRESTGKTRSLVVADGRNDRAPRRKDSRPVHRQDLARSGHCSAASIVTLDNLGSRQGDVAQDLATETSQYPKHALNARLVRRLGWRLGSLRFRGGVFGRTRRRRRGFGRVFCR